MSESGSGTVDGWTVEARSGTDDAIQFQGRILDWRWREIGFTRSEHGVPSGPSYRQPWLSLTGRFTYEAAQALRWWLHAQAESEDFGASVSLETRLVKWSVKYEYAVERIGHREENAFDDRRWVGLPKNLTTEPDAEAAPAAARGETDAD